MAKKKVGLWLIGACGGVGTTAALGLAAIRNKLSDTTSLVTELPLFETLKLDALDSFVVGGHEIRKGSFVETAKELHLKAKIFDAAMLAGSEKDLAEWSKNIKPGSAVESGSTIAKMADLKKANVKETPRQTIKRIQTDLKNFQKANDRGNYLILGFDFGSLVGGIIEDNSIAIAKDIMTDPAKNLPVAQCKHGSEHRFHQRFACLAILPCKRGTLDFCEFLNGRE